VLAAASALGAALFLLLWSSSLEAEYVNVGTLLGRDDQEPSVRVLSLGLALSFLAGLLALAGFALGRRSS
jgi:hypothetical protein